MSLFDTLIVQPIFNLLIAIYGLVPGGDFGVALIIFTILVRLIMWPLVKKQLHQTKVMRKIQPELKKIKAKAKGLVPFLTIGDPDLETSYEILRRLPQAGADAVVHAARQRLRDRVGDQECSDDVRVLDRRESQFLPKRRRQDRQRHAIDVVDDCQHEHHPDHQPANVLEAGFGARLLRQSRDRH